MLRKFILACAAGLLASAFTFAQTPQKTEKKAPEIPKQTETQKTADPAPSASRPDPKFDIANLDRTADPCVDFYQFACGNWVKNNPVPSDYPVWAIFLEVQEHNLKLLHSILDKP